jgi:hypothetical protein
VALQRNAGGDALIGRRLHPLLTEAGYHDVTVSPRLVYVDGSYPQLRTAEPGGVFCYTFFKAIAGA